MLRPVAASRSFYRRLARHAGLPFVTLDPAHSQDPDYHPVNPLAAGLLSEPSARRHRMVAIAYRDGVVTVATPSPFDPLVGEIATLSTGREVRLALTSEQDLEAALEHVFRRAHR
jgi:hypothetical protein